MFEIFAHSFTDHIQPSAADDYGQLIVHAASADITSRASAIRELLTLLSKDTSDNRSEIVYIPILPGSHSSSHHAFSTKH